MATGYDEVIFRKMGQFHHHNCGDDPETSDEKSLPCSGADGAYETSIRSRTRKLDGPQRHHHDEDSDCDRTRGLGVKFSSETSDEKSSLHILIR